jgi:hypothetical protein
MVLQHDTIRVFLAFSGCFLYGTRRLKTVHGSGWASVSGIIRTKKSKGENKTREKG